MYWPSVIEIVVLLIIAFAVIPAIVRSIIAEVSLRREATNPPQCGSCKHEATLAMIASGRCPECGGAYLVAGIEGPLMRLQRQTKNYGIFTLIGVIGLVAGGVCAAISTQVAPLDLYQPWSGIGAFVLLASPLGVVPIVLIGLRRRRIRQGVMRAMAPPRAPDSVITKNDATSQPDRLESSPPSGDSSLVSPPSPTQGTP